MDFKKIHTKSYKVWRILQAPGVWAQIYRDRESMMANYSSAIIFPEQFLGLNQTLIFSVELTSRAQARSSAVTEFTTPKILLDRGAVSSFDDIYQWEAANDSRESMSGMTIGSYESFSNPLFHNMNLFTNRKDAVKMACRHLEKF